MKRNGTCPKTNNLNFKHIHKQNKNKMTYSKAQNYLLSFVDDKY